MSTSFLSIRLLSRITLITALLVTTLIATLCKTDSANALTNTESTSQVKNNEGRYQIEMIIFNRKSYQQYADSEFWRRDITLSYPQNYRQLTSTDTTNGTTTISTDHPTNVQTSFQIMADSAHTLGNLEYSLRNDNTYRVLFHEAWQQQIAEKNTPAIIIQGGNSIGQHYELEGSIQLRVSRYLHVETNLWFTRFSATVNSDSKENNYDDTIKNAIEGTKNSAVSGAIHDENGKINRAADNEWPKLPMPPIDNEQPAAIIKTINTDNLSHDAPIIENITTLNEKRRMRSSEELHYIDHPILGLLIIITPVEEVMPLAANYEDNATSP